ncbi:Uncharacterised protein [Actinomyces bovis]|uniref:Uncharacterized protein n=1 Tax=Actinomyces bovis TaxID=1658 RepID=A0ABY1VJZ0_9ACTO|nr:hypothetical protein [Actinomyces bovis]SPT52426.1 Uncharacterised protein [Actinomyces bovis]VEG54062.1 Uncharacterised protein [Actinomyces israelii]
MARGITSGSLEATVGATNRLTLARAALAHAEEHAGLRSMQERNLSEPLPGDGAADGTKLAQIPVGVTQVIGSTTVLLALAAKAQGEGWCAVLGGEDLGWCAAAELGLDLKRVLYIPAGERTGVQLLPVLGALLDGVDVVLVTASAASRLRARDRRSLLARVREREVRLLTDSPWEGARSLTASPQAEQGTAVVVPFRSLTAGTAELLTAPTAHELETGYLDCLTWSLQDPTRPGTHLNLSVGATGARWGEAGEARSRAHRPVRPGDIRVVV